MPLFNKKKNKKSKDDKNIISVLNRLRDKKFDMEIRIMLIEKKIQNTLNILETNKSKQDIVEVKNILMKCIEEKHILEKVYQSIYSLIQDLLDDKTIFDSFTKHWNESYGDINIISEDNLHSDRINNLIDKLGIKNDVPKDMLIRNSDIDDAENTINKSINEKLRNICNEKEDIDEKTKRSIGHILKITDEEKSGNSDSILEKEDNNDKINKEIEEILEKIDNNKE